MMPYDFHQPEAILRSIIISQDAFCEEFVVFNREDNVDKLLRLVIGHYEKNIYLPFILEECFVSISRIRSFGFK